MDLGGLNPQIQQHSFNRSGVNPSKDVSAQFANTLAQVVFRHEPPPIQASETLKKQEFRKRKDLIETGSNMQEDDEEESVYATVQKIEKRLIAMAHLERLSQLGF